MSFDTKKEEFIFYILPTFLFSLIPIFLITGPFLSDLAVSLIGIIFLIYCFKKKDFSFFKKNYFYFFLLFWMYLVLNSLLNNFNLSSLKISFFYIRFGIFIIAIVALLNFKAKFLNYFFSCLVLCFVILIFDGFYQYFFDENIIGLKKQTEYRVSSFFGEELILGSYISRLWPIFFATSVLLFNHNEKKFFLFFIIFVLSEVLVFLSGERTSFFYINMTAFFVIIFSNNVKKIRFITLISSFLIIIVISIFYPSAKERIIDKTINQSKIDKLEANLKSNFSIYIFSKQHTHHYYSAYKMFLDNKLFGVGVKNFRNLCDDSKYKISEISCSTHPHNTYVQILTEIGITGFLFILYLLVIFIYYISKHLILKIYKKKYFSDFEICLLSGIAIVLWPFAPTGNVFNNWLSVTYFLYLPLFIWSFENNNKLKSLTSYKK